MSEGGRPLPPVGSTGARDVCAPLAGAEDRGGRERSGGTTPPPAPGERVLPPVPVVVLRAPAPPPEPPGPSPAPAPPPSRSAPLTAGQVLLLVSLGCTTPALLLLLSAVLLQDGLDGLGLPPVQVVLLAVFVVFLAWVSGGALVVRALRAWSRQCRGLDPLPPRAGRGGWAGAGDWDPGDWGDGGGGGGD